MEIQTYEVVACPDNESSYTNKAIVNPQDFLKQLNIDHVAVKYRGKAEAFVFSVSFHPGVEARKMAFNLASRKWASLLANSEVDVVPYEFIIGSQCLNSITFFIDFLTRKNAFSSSDFDTEDMSRQFSQKFCNQAFTIGQLFAFSYDLNGKKCNLELKVKEMEAMKLEKSSKGTDVSNVEIGLTTPNTVILFEKAEGSEIKLTGGKTGQVSAPQIFSQNWDFAAMGVGGLGEQFNKIFRRAFASRLLPASFAERIGEEHVRGILLYGPPGTGKTLIARQIGNMLLAREPKIVNGPEVLNKYVGESEANVRKLFQDAIEEQAKSGINSGLHMIIFDEIDAICKARGTSGSSAGAGDNVVNQLLSMIDGVNALHNVLLIGMTNRRDLIDEALLRPGRLEIQIEIGLPNKQGRLEIFNIHTRKMRKEGLLDSSVDLDELSALAKNYTGAEIAGLTKAARSIAINRVIKIDSDDKHNITKEMLDRILVTRGDFLYAMHHDVKPALGASEDQLKELVRPIIHWDPEITVIQERLSAIIRLVPSLKKNRPYYMLLTGDPHAGLTTFAANMASDTKFPFIRVYHYRMTAAKAESAKVQYMEKLFVDAARSELSCIVLDGLEGILDYCRIGPRFSNTSRAVFTGNVHTPLPEGHRMLIICTCNSAQFLEELELNQVFSVKIRVPTLTRPAQVSSVLSNIDSVFTQTECKEILSYLSSIPFKIGIKKLEQIIEAAIEDKPDERVTLFLERIRD